MRDRPRYYNPTENDSRNRDRWLISYADLLTLLLALFIVMYAASDKERARQIVAGLSNGTTFGTGVLPGTDTPEKDERAKFEQKLLENPILIQRTKMRQSKAGLVVSLSEAGFFAPGEAVINSEALAVINTLADSLKGSTAQIRIEGHTDSTPISNARYPSNWELSTARASSVLVRLMERGIEPERLSAAGYGGFQPVADNQTLEGRAQNRRVDVVIISH